MRVLVLVIALTIGACYVSEASEDPTWQEFMTRADSLVTARRLEEAAALVDSALSQALARYGRSDSTVRLDRFEGGIPADCYMHESAEFEEVFRRALAAREKIFGPTSEEVAGTLRDLADLQVSRREYDSAADLFERALAIAHSLDDNGQPEIARALRGIGLVKRGQYEHAKADSVLKQSLALFEASLGTEHPEVALTLRDLGFVCWMQGRMDEAEQLLERAHSIWRKALGDSHPYLATVLSIRGRLSLRMGRHAEADSFFNESIRTAEALLGPEDPEVLSMLNNLGYSHVEQGRYAEAESLHIRVLATRERTLGPEHPDVARDLRYLGYVYIQWGEFARAESIYTRAVAITEKAFGPDDLQVAGDLERLAGACYEHGRFARARQLYERVLAIRKKAYGPNHPAVAGDLLNLANVLSFQGRYTEAERRYLRALAIFEKAYGPEHSQVGLVLNNLGDSYRGWGRYEEAEELLKRAIEVKKKALGPEHRLVASSLGNLATVYLCQGRYAEADSLARQALAVMEKAFPPGHPDFGFWLSDLAEIAYVKEDYDETERLLKRVIELWLEGVSPEYQDLHLTMGSLGHLYTTQGRYTEAESLYTKAITMARAAPEADPRVFANLLESCSRFHRYKGDQAEALEYAKEAFALSREHFGDLSDLMLEREALIFGKYVKEHASNCLSIYFDRPPDDNAAAEAIADIVVAAKGQASEPLFLRAAEMNMASQLGVLSDSLREARARVSDLYVAGGRSQAELDRPASTGWAVQHKEDLENAMAQLTASSRNLQEVLDADSRAVVQILNTIPGRSVLVEYIKYDCHQVKPDSTIPRYAVVVIDRDGVAGLADLGAADEIDGLVEEYREHLLRLASSGQWPTPTDAAEYRTLGEHLYRRLWTPIETYFPEDALIMVAPDGGLNLVSFTGLIDENERYLIERYLLHYVSSARDLVRLKDPGNPGSGLLALGDPDYDADVAARLGQKQFASRDTTLFLASAGSRNVRSGCGELKDLTVPPLPWTNTEVELIAERWESGSDEPVIVQVGPAASEDCFQAEAPGKRVLHLATHGYFLQGACEAAPPKRAFGQHMDPIGENPLLLSGLFLAGGNLHGEGADRLGAEDGILTAEEVTTMNLLGTQLVVLSACETGLGEVREGEGVYGLRRAFQMAGARTVISALWPVSDKTTADMMSQLYERKDESIPETMRRIQLDKINELRSQGKPDHPFTWAGFIALGDWK